MLDDKIKSMRGGGAIGGGGAGNAGLNASLSDDLEAAIARLREDLDKHMNNYERDQAKVKEELAQKATKQDLEDLEARMMQRM